MFNINDDKYMASVWIFAIHTGVSERNTPFVQASALQPSNGDCDPPPESVLRKLIFPRAFFYGGVFLPTDAGSIA